MQRSFLKLGLGTRYIFPGLQERSRKIWIIYLRAMIREQSDRQKVLHPFPLPKSMGGAQGAGIERERVYGSLRKFAEVRWKCMNAPWVRKYTLFLSRWIELRAADRRYQSVRKFRSRGASRSSRDSFPSGMQTSQRTRTISYEIGGSRHKNFNLDIFKRIPADSHSTWIHVFFEPSLSYTCINLLLYSCVNPIPMPIIWHRGSKFKRVAMKFRINICCSIYLRCICCEYRQVRI